MLNILNRLSRITSSGKYIPELDGLRFLAIITVVLCHIGEFYRIKTGIGIEDTPFWYFPFKIGGQGVQLFFVISGFILSLSFALAYSKGRKIKLKDYFVKRLTRLEPPYIIAMLIFFVILIVTGKGTFTGLIDNLFASLLYVHNLWFGKGSDINTVAWSLEVEVQFYLLTPLLSYVFLLARRTRLVTLVSACIGFLLLNNCFDIYYRTILGQAHYFLLGYILTDIYLYSKFSISRVMQILLGFLSLGIILFTDIKGQYFWIESMYLVAILVFYFLVLKKEFWKGILSIRAFAIIGGMCYSIYLLHYPIVSFIGNFMVTRTPDLSFGASYILYALIIIPIILVISSIYFYWVERPCMDKLWPQKLWAKVKGLYY